MNMEDGDITKIDLLVKYDGNRKSKEAWGRIKKLLDEPCKCATGSQWVRYHKHHPLLEINFCPSCGGKLNHDADG